MEYIVVFRSKRICTKNGVMFWASFPDEDYFNEWYVGKRQEWYEAIEEGVSKTQAIKLCSSPYDATLRFKCGIVTAQELPS